MTDTYDRRIQLGASRRRREDAEILHNNKRWTGAIYLGGYAIECSLKSLICYNERKDNFKDTETFKKGLQGSSLHSLVKLGSFAEIEKAIVLDRTNTYKPAWNTVSSLWRNDELRYSDKQGNETNSKEFINAVKILHGFLLREQGEIS